MIDWLDEFGRRVTGDLELSPPEFLVEWRITPTEFSQLREALGRVGVLAGLATTLAGAGVSIFAISTFHGLPARPRR